MISRRFKKYTPFISAGLKISLSYRLDFICYRLGDILEAVVTYFLWISIFNSSNAVTIGGFSIQQMKLYVFLSFFVSVITKTGVSDNIGEEVKDGSISMRLLKPINFVDTYLFSEIGIKLLQIIMLAVPIFGGILIFQSMNTSSVPVNFLNILFFAFSAILSYFINFYFNVCFGFTAFVSKNLWGARVMKQAIIAFMSGSLIPLSFFPKIIATVLQIFPFGSFVYTPVMIYLGKYQELELLEVLGIQLFWTLAFYLLSRFIWSVVISKLTIQGG